MPSKSKITAAGLGTSGSYYSARILCGAGHETTVAFGLPARRHPLVLRRAGVVSRRDDGANRRTRRSPDRQGLDRADARAGDGALPRARRQRRGDQGFQDRLGQGLRRRRRRERHAGGRRHDVSGGLDQQAGGRDGRGARGAGRPVRARSGRQHHSEIVEAARQRVHARPSGHAARADEPHLRPRRRLRLPGLPPVRPASNRGADPRRQRAVQRRQGPDGAAAVRGGEVLGRRRHLDAAADDRRARRPYPEIMQTWCSGRLG